MKKDRRTPSPIMLLSIRIAALILFGLVTAIPAAGQVSKKGLEGAWQGTLSAGSAKLRLVLNISKSDDGLYLGTLNSLDQGATIPIDTIKVDGDSVRLELKSIRGVFEGSFNEDHKELTGTWTQGGPALPLSFTRVDKVPQAAPAASPAPLDVPIDLGVAIAPTPFTGGGKVHLVYELHITNFSGRELNLKSLEVTGDNGPLARFDGADLNKILSRPGVAGITDKRKLGPGLRAVAYIWLTLDSDSRVPSSIRHRVTVDDRLIDAYVIAIPTIRPVVIAPPLRGSKWLAANGPSDTSFHRRALIPVMGKARIAQRFAIDWVRIGPDTKTFTGDPKDNRNYLAYGSEVLAVADAIVAATKDGIPENIPGAQSRAVPITLETVGGNHIILDLGNGRFGFYAHLQPGSLRVKVGDKVRRGQVIGLVGNSGNSTEPHLHFHVADANSPLGAEGVPYLLESFEVSGPGSSPEVRKNQLPLQNEIVRFAN